MLSLSKTKTFQFLITAGNILFLLLYSILVYYNRYAADDYFFEYNARSRGIWGGIVYQYNAWTGRPAETFLLNVLATFFSEHMVLMIYGVSALLLLFLAIFKLTQFILNRLSLEISTFLILNFSLLFCCLFFFSSISIGETWFWLCSSSGYLGGLVALLWGLYFLVNGKKSILNYFLLTICFAYTMGAAELFSATIVLMLIFIFAVLVFRFRKETSVLFQNTIFKKTIFVFTICLVGLCFVYYGSGAQHRKSLLVQSSVAGTFFIATKALIWFFIFKLPARLPYLILFASPFILMGNLLQSNSHASTIFNKKHTLNIIGIFIVFNFLALLPACYIMSEMGPDRALTFNSFLCACLSAYGFAFIGYKFNSSLLRCIPIAGLIAGICLITYFAVRQYPIAKNYAAAIDERIVLVQEENKKGRTELLELKPLPRPGFYYSAEISNDTALYRNTFFKQRFNLGFNCVVK